MSESQTSHGNSMDAVIAVYARDIDKASLDENLKLSHQERLEKFLRSMKLIYELRKNNPGRQRAT